MVEHTEVVNIGDTDTNADWIKTAQNRKEEEAIHDSLAKKKSKEAKERLAK